MLVNWGPVSMSPAQFVDSSVWFSCSPGKLGVRLSNQCARSEWPGPRDDSGDSADVGAREGPSSMVEGAGRSDDAACAAGAPAVVPTPTSTRPSTRARRGTRSRRPSAHPDESEKDPIVDVTGSHLARTTRVARGRKLPELQREGSRKAGGGVNGS